MEALDFIGRCLLAISPTHPRFPGILEEDTSDNLKLRMFAMFAPPHSVRETESFTYEIARDYLNEFLMITATASNDTCYFHASVIMSQQIADAPVVAHWISQDDDTGDTNMVLFNLATNPCF